MHYIGGILPSIHLFSSSSGGMGRDCRSSVAACIMWYWCDIVRYRGFCITCYGVRLTNVCGMCRWKCDRLPKDQVYSRNVVLPAPLIHYWVGEGLSG